jgi:hypothetical protein
MSPGGGNPAVMGGQPQPGPQMGGGMPTPPQSAMPQQAAGGSPAAAPQRPMAPPPPVQPFRSIPSAPASNDAAAGSVPPPPAAAPGAQPDATGGQRPFNLKSIVQGLKSAGVAPERVMDMLDALTPAMTAENKAELDAYKTHNAALSAANRAYAAVIAAGASQQRADTGVRAEERRGRQGDENIQIKRDKEARLAQQLKSALGGGKLKSKEYLYPNGPDGKPDATQPPIGVRGMTDSGKIINLDADGNQVASQQGSPAPKGGQKNSAVRESIVKAGVTNAIARLNEIDKLGDVATSSFFGTHGENPLTRGAYGAGKAMQTKGQQEADAKWASMIDEAIPVFTGGLRGSDAFRRFLIEQAPGPGDKPETIREKKRLFRQNIEGTSKAFFNKYSSDPSMWAPGVTADQVKGGGAAAPQQGEWKVEKVN